jgi:cytochrome bd-type quinol oxidase subunit 2
MQLLSYALYAGCALLVIVLMAGIINLARTDEKQASRSNKLMRMRVIVQAVIIAILVGIGFVSGAINF